jgi:hypothetical protein
MPSPVAHEADKFCTDGIPALCFCHSQGLQYSGLDSGYAYKHSLPNMFLRRLGQNGQEQCSTGAQCPQILEMTDGDFAAAGPDITAEATASLPPGPGVGPNEGIVRIPRKVMLAAVSDIVAAA